MSSPIVNIGSYLKLKGIVSREEGAKLKYIISQIILNNKCRMNMSYARRTELKQKKTYF
jgi:hypothetical protein